MSPVPEGGVIVAIPVSVADRYNTDPIASVPSTSVNKVTNPLNNIPSTSGSVPKATANTVSTVYIINASLNGRAVTIIINVTTTMSTNSA